MQKLAAGSLLVNCLRTRFGGALDPGAFAVAPAAWAALPAEATRQSVAPLLYERLRALEGIARPPAPVTAALRQAYIRSAFRNAIVFRELGAAATELQRRGIDVIGLKGVHLATQIWDDPAIRGMADIDILVPFDRLAE
ncbi:MAG: nucleotidyltransferase family protein, partial [Longimicrobiales bacterium]